MSTKGTTAKKDTGITAAHVIMILGFVAIIAAASMNLITIGAVGVALMAISVPLYFHAMNEGMR